MSPTAFRILVALRAGKLSASDIVDRIETLDPDGKKPPLASFYRELNGLFDRRLVEIVDEAPSPGPGRPRRMYMITADGSEAVRREGRRLGRLVAIALGAGAGEARS